MNQQAISLKLTLEPSSIFFFGNGQKAVMTKEKIPEKRVIIPSTKVPKRVEKNIENFAIMYFYSNQCNFLNKYITELSRLVSRAHMNLF